MHRSYRIAVSLAATLLLAGAIPASAVTTDRANAADSATGCLQKGDKPDTFKLVGKDGKTWDVWSKKVSLAGHVGHTVTLTGDVTKGGMSGMKDTSMSKMGDSSKMSGMSMSSGSMNVSSMAMVSATCS
ncbi:MAG: hypothetical protein M3Y30_00245 [Gemmatimonadota bacterium]|nr:hypothetical protein [Gemmatimonadota bacterium]